MKLKNILNEAAEILGVDPKSEHKILMRCANFALYDVATNYYDCVRTETFDVKNQEIAMSEFKEKVHKIRKCSVSYHLFPDFIGVPNGMVTVEYAAIPEYKRQDENIATRCSLMDEVILLYGILANYASICTLKEEEKIFRHRFEAAVLGVYRGKPRKMRVVICK